MPWQVFPVARFGDFAEEWDRLNEASQRSPLLAVAFITPLIETFAAGTEQLAVCRGDDKPIAMAILERRGQGVWQTFQPSQAPLGLWLCKPEQTLAELLPALANALPGIALSVGLTQQDPALMARPADTDKLATLDYIQTARISISGSFDAYWEARGKNLRHNMKRQRAKLRSDGISPTLEVITDADQVATAIRDYGVLESAGWKAAGGTAIHPDNAQGKFYRAMLANFCRQGAARMYRYRYNDRVVAVDLCIEGFGVIVILKTTYDESIRTSSPASLMHQEALRAIFDEARLERIEFYGKLMDWHTKWSDEVRTLYHVNCYRHRWVPKLREWVRGFKPPKSTENDPAPEAAVEPGAARASREGGNVAAKVASESEA